MSFEIPGILFWLLAGSITGAISGWMTARAINEFKEGRYFHEGHAPIKYLIGGIAGVLVATAVFQQYYGGFVYLLPLFASWFTVEALFKNYLVARYERQKRSGS